MLTASLHFAWKAEGEPGHSSALDPVDRAASTLGLDRGAASVPCTSSVPVHRISSSMMVLAGVVM